AARTGRGLPCAAEERDRPPGRPDPAGRTGAAARAGLTESGAFDCRTVATDALRGRPVTPTCRCPGLPRGRGSRLRRLDRRFRGDDRGAGGAYAHAAVPSPPRQIL